jgi:hypothetical protein
MSTTRKLLSAGVAVCAALALSAAPASASPLSQMRSWARNGGMHAINLIVKDANAISASANADDLQEIGIECAAFSTDLRVAQDHPMPDKAIQVHWAAMLKDYQLGTYYCVQGINDNSSSDLQTFINYASAGNNQLGIAEKMVEKLVK